MSLADFIAYSFVIGAICALGVMIWNYARGLRQSPRDLWLLFIYKIAEYAAYSSTNMTLVLWLSKDCGRGDVAAGSFVSAWSILLSLMNMVAGALVDTIGIRKTLILSVVFLTISRLFMSFVTQPALVMVLGFVPLAIGFAIVSPLVSVAIKRYTTKEGAAMGFGIFYILMNAGYAVGYSFFDWARYFHASKDAAGKVIDESAGTVLLGLHFSTYQLIFLYGLIATAISLAVALVIREGVEVTPDGRITIRPLQDRGSGLLAIRNAAVQTGRTIGTTVREKYFWIYIGMLALTVPVRTVFLHFHYTFPKYGIRVLGEGAKVGSIYGVLNPILIVLLVPIAAFFTKKLNSYKVMTWGAAVSALACFIGLMPGEWFAPLTHSVLGELVFIKWLGMAPDMATLLQNPPSPMYWTLLLLIFVFTIGESIWSPRLLQFTAEIAPKGKEGTYIALSVLPFFVAKFFVGPMSGLLVRTYTPVDPVTQKALASYPDHWMVWVWIGVVAVVSPIGLLLLRKQFLRHDIA